MSSLITQNSILNHLKEHCEFKDKYNVQDIGIFGSYVRYEATPESDIDICMYQNRFNRFVCTCTLKR